MSVHPLFSRYVPPPADVEPYEAEAFQHEPPDDLMHARRIVLAVTAVLLVASIVVRVVLG